MNISETQINQFAATQAYSQHSDQVSPQETNQFNNNSNEKISFQDELNILEAKQVEETKTSVLNGKEKATLHALFGYEKPFDLNFYGKTQIENIHRGQLLDLKG